MFNDSIINNNSPSHNFERGEKQKTGNVVQSLRRKEEKSADSNRIHMKL